jgi:hypothetical protein
MSRVFHSISVQPTYGLREAAIRWVLDPEYDTADVYVYRSATGVKPWTLLNETDPSTTGEFLDTDLELKRDADVPFYRLLAYHDGVYHESSIFRPFDQISRREYGACRRIIHMIYTQFSRGDALPMYLLKARSIKESGLSNVDPNTGQITGPPCDDVADYAKLYDPVVQTWVKLQPPNVSVKSAAEDIGLQEAILNRGTALGFPYPRHGDMLIQPQMDDRYAVIQSEPNMFKGMIPVTFNLALVKLPRDDTRYKVMVPDYKREF